MFTLVQPKHAVRSVSDVLAGKGKEDAISKPTAASIDREPLSMHFATPAMRSPHAARAIRLLSIVASRRTAPAMNIFPDLFGVAAGKVPVGGAVTLPTDSAPSWAALK